VNLSIWWEDAQYRAPSEEDLQRIHDLGFDFVRVPVSSKWLEVNDRAELEENLHNLHCDVIRLLSTGLSVILDFHPSASFQASIAKHPEKAVGRIEGLLAEMWPAVVAMPPHRVYLEIYNEPVIEAQAWWKMQGQIIDDLRPLFPDTTFVASPGPANGAWFLVNLKPYRDRNVIYDFHFYEPLQFTHHGAEWLPKTDWSPVVYPVDKSFAFDMTKPEIRQYVAENWRAKPLFDFMKKISKWRDYYDVKVVCLEYGALRGHVDDKSRYQWLYDVRTALERFNMGWALWEYRGPFGLVDIQGNFDKGMAASLGLLAQGSGS
jgi:hypothetical protein